MPKARQHYMRPDGLDYVATDKRIKLLRCSDATRYALHQARRLRDGMIAQRFGAECVRCVLLFVDDREHPDYLGKVLFSLANRKTVIADVNADGKFVGLTLRNVDTRKRVFRSFMYDLFGLEYSPRTASNDYYSTRIYARNITCYE